MPNRYANVRELLDSLAGCTRAKVTLEDGQVTSLDVEFEPAPMSATPFVTKDGKPVNLDEGMPALAQDPDAGGADTDTDGDIERANFAKRPAEAS